MAEVSSGFWKGFAQGVAEWGDRLGMENMQVRLEERAEAREIDREAREEKSRLHMATELRKDAYEGLKQELPLRQKYEFLSLDKLQDLKIGYLDYQQKLTEDWYEDKKKFDAKLAASYGDFEYTSYKKKAVTSGDTDMQNNVLKWEREANLVLSGQKELDLDVFNGAPPMWVSTISNIAQEKWARKREVDNEMNRTTLLIKNAEDAASAQKSLNESRKSTAGKRVWDMYQDVVDAEKEASEKFMKARGQLMTDLVKAGVLDKKGGFNEGSGAFKRNLPLYEKVLNEKKEVEWRPQLAVQAALEKRYPNWAFRFDDLNKLQAEAALAETARETFYLLEQKEKVESDKGGVPEAEIQKGMALGLSREQAIQWYNDMKEGVKK